MFTRGLRKKRETRSGVFSENGGDKGGTGVILIALSGLYLLDSLLLMLEEMASTFCDAVSMPTKKFKKKEKKLLFHFSKTSIKV